MSKIAKPLHRRMWSKLLFWRYKNFYQHRYDHLVLETVLGTPLLILPQVFNPALLRTGEFLAKQLNAQRIRSNESVLDMGTGSGVGAVFATRFAQRVVAVDINPNAVRCAQLNMLMHRLENKMEVRQGDLFSSVCEQKFDWVLFNPPFYRGQPKNELDHAWRGPDVLERFAAQLRAHLNPGGHALLVFSTDNDIPEFLKLFEANGFSHHIVAQRDFVNEVITVYQLSP